MARCSWSEASDQEREYHDSEWGVPLHGEKALFEFLTLEGAQAGLSWRTVLAKRAGYRRVFLDYDIDQLAQLDDPSLQVCLLDTGIVRNRLKVWSVRGNARATLALYAAGSSLDALLWSFVHGKPLQNSRTAMSDVPARTEASDRMSKALAKHGFKFVGSTICYALMQATGMVNDHLIDCPEHAKCARLA